VHAAATAEHGPTWSRLAPGSITVACEETNWLVNA
jgi:hypothetical protein